MNHMVFAMAECLAVTSRCRIETALWVELLNSLILLKVRYGYGAGNTVEENSSVVSLIRMC